MRPAGWEGVRRVLVMRLDNVGDVVMTSPALRTLRQALPEAQLTLMASPAGARAAPLLPWVDELMEHRALWQDLGSLPFDPQRELELVGELRERRFDAAVILTSFSQSPHAPGYLCYLSGIPIRLGASKEFGGGCLSLAAPPGDDATHQAERNLALLEAAGFEAAGRHLEIRVPEQARRGLAATLGGSGAGERWLVVSPWASCEARTYFPERMARAAALICRELGLRPVLTGLPRHREAAGPLLALLGPRAVDLVGRLDLLEFAALVERAELVLCNNTGTMHLAEALGVPMVVTYSGTDLESQWRPRFAPARLLRRPTPCHPCYAFTCDIGRACLDLDPAEVADAALELAGGRRSHAAPA